MFTRPNCYKVWLHPAPGRKYRQGEKLDSPRLDYEICIMFNYWLRPRLSVRGGGAAVITRGRWSEQPAGNQVITTISTIWPQPAAPAAQQQIKHLSQQVPGTPGWLLAVVHPCSPPTCRPPCWRCELTGGEQSEGATGDTCAVTVVTV